jgi:hypothetical protein
MMCCKVRATIFCPGGFLKQQKRYTLRPHSFRDIIDCGAFLVLLQCSFQSINILVWYIRLHFCNTHSSVRAFLQVRLRVKQETHCRTTTHCSTLSVISDKQYWHSDDHSPESVEDRAVRIVLVIGIVGIHPVVFKLVQEPLINLNPSGAAVLNSTLHFQSGNSNVDAEAV